jgi:hypothetical protein
MTKIAGLESGLIVAFFGLRQELHPFTLAASTEFPVGCPHRHQIYPPTHQSDTAMRLNRNLHALFLIGASFSGLNAQEIATKWDVEIPAPITDGTPSPPPPKPEPIDFEVLSSRTTRMDVTKAPEMPDLPPITGTINVIVQLVENPNLPEPPPPLPALPPDDPAVIARLAEPAEKHRGTELVFLSATVYDHNRTLLRIYPNGKFEQQVEAWSNIDFNHFGGFATYRVKDAVDGTLYDFGLLMGIGGIDTRRWKEMAEARGIEYEGPEIPEIPNFPHLADGGPAFAVVEGEKDSPAMNTLEQLHDLYRKEGPPHGSCLPRPRTSPRRAQSLPPRQSPGAGGRDDSRLA